MSELETVIFVQELQIQEPVKHNDSSTYKMKIPDSMKMLMQLQFDLKTLFSLLLCKRQCVLSRKAN